MALDTTLLNTQHYKVRIKGKVEQSMESAVTIEKGTFELPSTTVANFTITLLINFLIGQFKILKILRMLQSKNQSGPKVYLCNFVFWSSGIEVLFFVKNI